MEEPRPELLLQRLHMGRDGPGRDPEFHGRRRKAAQTGRGLEGAQRVERRQAGRRRRDGHGEPQFFWAKYS